MFLGAEEVFVKIVYLTITTNMIEAYKDIQIELYVQWV